MGSPPQPLNVDAWEFIRPFLASFIVFGAFWHSYVDQGSRCKVVGY